MMSEEIKEGHGKTDVSCKHGSRWIWWSGRDDKGDWRKVVWASNCDCGDPPRPDKKEAEDKRLKEQLKRTEFPNGLWLTNATWDAVNKRADDAEARLRAAQELPEKWRKESINTVNDYYSDELEAALGGCVESPQGEKTP